MAKVQRRCSVEDCYRPVVARGWCNAHYKRWRKHGDPLTKTQRANGEFTEEWFWAQVDRSGGSGACWPWQKGLGGGGYGNLRLNRRNIAAHRMAYLLDTGITSDELPPCVLHLCDNPPCCNPDHLWPGTCAINNYDARQKNRHRWGNQFTKSVPRQ